MSTDPCGAGDDADGCREALDTLYHFLDGELTEVRRHQIQHHLDECSPCLGAFDFEAELKVVIARRCKDQVPEHLRLRVAAVLAQASGHPVPDGRASGHPVPDGRASGHPVPDGAAGSSGRGSGAEDE